VVRYTPHSTTHHATMKRVSFADDVRFDGQRAKRPRADKRPRPAADLGDDDVRSNANCVAADKAHELAKDCMDSTRPTKVLVLLEKLINPKPGKIRKPLTEKWLASMYHTTESEARQEESDTDI
jgi:hypothetical protein